MNLSLKNKESTTLISIIVIGIFIRLIKINQPFIDSWSWRQSDVAMIARNFYLNGYRILQPQIDWAGNAPGYVGTEFQLVPFLAALIYRIFGEHEWIGRSISVTFFAVSLPFFYFLVKRIFGSRAAIYAICFYIVSPLSIYTSRSFMPDMPSLSLAIIAVYFFYDWIKKESNRLSLFASSIILCLAILIKIPAIIVGLPMLYLVWQKYNWRCFKKLELWLYGTFVLLLPLLWYSYASIVANSNPPYHFFGEGGLGIKNLKYYWPIFERTFIAPQGITPLVSILMLCGLFFVPKCNGTKCNERWFFHWWLFAMFIFLIFAAWGNRHPWYQLPFVPVAATLAGVGLDVIFSQLTPLAGNKKFRRIILCLLFVSVGIISFSQSALGRYSSWNYPALEAGMTIRKETPKNSLILAVSQGDPTLIYYSNRKGWHFFSWDLYDDDKNVQKLEQCRKEGARYLVIDKYYFYPKLYASFMKHLENNYKYFRRDDNYVIFDISSPAGKILEKSNKDSVQACLTPY